MLNLQSEKEKKEKKKQLCLIPLCLEILMKEKVPEVLKPTVGITGVVQFFLLTCKPRNVSGNGNPGDGKEVPKRTDPEFVS